MEVIEKGSGPKRTLCERARHCLEVVAAALLSILGVKHPSTKGRHDIMDSYNAVELEKGGIIFKSFSKLGAVGSSSTNTFPWITVSEILTEVFFRNMLALEFNDVGQGESVTR